MDEAELKRQFERLQAAGRDRALLDLVPRIVAAQFGAIPIGTQGGELEVALPEGTAEEVVDGLARALGRRIRVAWFEDWVVAKFIDRLYGLGDLNFNTFVEEDFLRRDESRPLLLVEKPMHPVPPRVAGAPGRVALLDFAYRSVLEHVDRRHEAVNFEEQKEPATDLGFAVDEGGGDPEAVLARAGPVAAETLLIAQESYSYGGLQHKHGYRVHDVNELPFMIHPSELQVVAIDEEAIDVLVYDRVERVRPGETPRFDVQYHFLSFGRRLRRRLTLRIYGVWLVRRERLRCVEGPLPWTPKHLERWFGHDL